MCIIKIFTVQALYDEFGGLPESERNRKINHRTAANLNNTAKRVWGDEDRVFRDSRAVWARYVFEEHFRKDARWKKVDEDVFWHEQLGHEDLDTQQAYKQFKLVEGEPAAGDRVSAVRDLLRHPDVMKRGALAKITNWALDVLKSDPGAKITQHRIITEVGSGRGVIKDWLALAESALDMPVKAPRAMRDRQKEPEQNTPEKPKPTEKPRVRAVQHGDEWLVSIELAGMEYEYSYPANEYTRNQAMSAAWSENQGGS